jgi:hypothetical protein
MILIFHLNIIAGKVYVIADTSISGNCVLHIERFCDNSITVDITSIFIQAYTGTINHRMISIFSVNETRTIKPVGKTREGCSLNMIIGVSPNNSKLLHRFMNSNPFTYLPRPNSIHILVVDSLRRLPFPKFIITLPTSIYILKFPPLYLNNHIALHFSPSYFYLCLSCRVVL